ISSRAVEAMRHVHITLAVVCELNSVYCSSGSNLSLTTGHMTEMSTHSLSMIFGTASTLMLVFTTITLTHETSLSSRFVHFSSERSLLNITSDTESYPPNHRCPREVPAPCTNERQLPNQLPIYAPMDRYTSPGRPIYPGSIPKQQRCHIHEPPITQACRCLT